MIHNHIRFVWVIPSLISPLPWSSPEMISSPAEMFLPLPPIISSQGFEIRGIITRLPISREHAGNRSKVDHRTSNTRSWQTAKATETRWEPIKTCYRNTELVLLPGSQSHGNTLGTIQKQITGFPKQGPGKLPRSQEPMGNRSNSFTRTRSLNY